MVGPDLIAAARAAFAARDEAGRSLVGQASAIALACRDLAARFDDGATLFTFGNGGPTTDAQHISVEFVHPVIVGKRALPAVSLASDSAATLGAARRHGPDEAFAHALGVLAGPRDVALGVSSDGWCRNVLRALESGHRRGLLTIALVGGDGGAIAQSPAVDHLITVASTSAMVVKEVHVTAYHLLWELVHVFLDGGAGDPMASSSSASQDANLAGLYPFLYDQAESGRSGSEDLVVDVARSSAAKAEQIIALRQRVATEQAEALADAARVVARSFAGGGRLLACGNGGSSSDAQQVVQCHLDPQGDLRPLPALCLTNDVAVVTALSNDVAFDVAFARQVRAFGRPGDVLVGLSTSGGSANVLAAFDAARAAGLTTVGYAGHLGGAMATAGTIDHLFVVPSDSVHRIQEAQTTTYHVLRELTDLALGPTTASD